MMRMGSRIRLCCTATLVLFATGCATRPDQNVIRYVGSSTIGLLMADAELEYGRCRIRIWTEPESYGGEQAVLHGVADIGGVARGVDPAVTREGVVSTCIGMDAIAVIVDGSNRLTDLSTQELRAIFTGRTTNWKELGGPDVPIKPLIVSRASATRNIFRAAVLQEQAYANCEVVEPDRRMMHAVETTKGAIGQISFAFLPECDEVRPLAIDGQQPTVRNSRYPITRPLHLCTRGRPRGKIKAFIDWFLSADGQALVRKRFVGVKPAG